MLQKDLFLKFEGNQWFLRNERLINRKTPDVELIKKYTRGVSGNILEIGCANGSKLNQFVFRSKGYGIDPSLQAVCQGKEKYPHLQLQVGTADKLPYKDAFFDVLIFGFCLYLVDRCLLLRCMSEADRVLKDCGFLIITDFNPGTPVRRIYKNFIVTK